MERTEHDAGWYLLASSAGQLCALPIGCVLEVAPMLKYRPLAGAPEFVLGVSVLRGEPVPVVDLGALVSGGESHATRLVSLRVAERAVALAVERVVGCCELPSAVIRSLPALLSPTTSGASGLGVLDGQLVAVLQAGRALPETLLASLQQPRAATGDAS